MGSIGAVTVVVGRVSSSDSDPDDEEVEESVEAARRFRFRFRFLVGAAFAAAGSIADM